MAWQRSRRRPFRSLGLAVLATGCAAPYDNEYFDPASTKPSVLQPALDSGAAATRPVDAREMEATVEIEVDARMGRPDDARPRADAAPTAASTCKMTFDFTTVSYGGNYAPDNIGAVWIVDAKFNFIRTLKKWTKDRTYLLDRWQETPGSNDIDAVTGPTATEHDPQHVTWDCKVSNGRPVKYGAYHVQVEYTEQNDPGQLETIDFTVGPAAVTVTPKVNEYFQNMQLRLTP